MEISIKIIIKKSKKKVYIKLEFSTLINIQNLMILYKFVTSKQEKTDSFEQCIIRKLFQVKDCLTHSGAQNRMSAWGKQE